MIAVVSSLLLLRRNRELGVFALAAVLISLSPGGALHSMPRYTLAGFPLFVGIGERLGNRALAVVVVLFAAGQVALAAIPTLFRSAAP